jgi:hypothetical protein
MKSTFLKQTIKRGAVAAALAVVSLGWSRDAAAVDALGVTVTFTEQWDAGGTMYYYFGTSDDTHFCSNPRWITTQKSIFDLALAAQLSGKMVNVTGYEGCWGDDKEVLILQMH